MKTIIKKLLLSSFILASTFSTAHADILVGEIKGASCYLHATNCLTSKEDPHVQLENDFIFVTDSEYYFLPNFPRHIKISLLNSVVKVKGHIKSHEIDVSTVFKKQAGKFKNIWDEQKYSADYAG